MIPRIDPRRPFVIGPSGLRRIVLGSTEGERDLRRVGAGHAAVKAPRLKHTPTGCVLVLAHTDRGSFDEHAREAIAAAALLARDDEEVVVLAPSVDGAAPDDVASLGIDRLELLALNDAVSGAAVLGSVLGRCAALRPRWLLVPDRDADGDLGRRVAVQLGWPVAGPVLEIAERRVRVRDHGALQRRAGDATAPLDELKVLLLARQVARTELPFVGQGETTTLAAPRTDVAEPGLTVLETRSGQAQQVALEEAEFIVAAGNGVRDVKLFGELAVALGAAVGASRVAVDDGRFVRTQQIGATGKTVQARGYLAIGISGAVQHLQGIKECRHVIAVNTDTSAPIAQRSELLVSEDAQALMKALLNLIRQAPRQEVPQ